MFRVFSGSCLSLEDMETVVRPCLVEQPHLLGPGADFFTESGVPVRPRAAVQHIQKVFSGSALDLNAMNGELSNEDILSPMAQQQRTIPVSTILNQISSETEKEKAKTAKSKIHVLVVGDNGYLATHVVIKLLGAGYSVRMTVPNASNYDSQVNIFGLNRETAQRLSVIEADFTNCTALRDAIRGCRYIIHCGCSNIAVQEKDPVAFYTKVIRALFDGIRVAGKSTVKRVVLTGAASSVFHITEPQPPSGMFDESCWNSVATMVTDPIPFAKMVFEREAWRLRQMMGVELVVLLPSISIGPSRTEETSEAMLTIESLANAPYYFPFCPNLYWNFVDVRDVAEAHVRALESPNVSNQRIIVSNECLSLTEICQMMKSLYPHLNTPRRAANTLLTILIAATQSSKGVNIRFLWRSLGVRKRLDNRCAIEALGLQFTPMRDTLSACLDQMIASGELPPPPSTNSPPAKNGRLGRRACFRILAVAAICGGITTYFLHRRK